ncbi:hypothetical protein CBL_12532 [Carabus blaptoides fortunei]
MSVVECVGVYYGLMYVTPPPIGFVYVWNPTVTTKFPGQINITIHDVSKHMLLKQKDKWKLNLQLSSNTLTETIVRRTLLKIGSRSISDQDSPNETWVFSLKFYQLRTLN